MFSERYKNRFSKRGKFPYKKGSHNVVATCLPKRYGFNNCKQCSMQTMTQLSPYIHAEKKTSKQIKFIDNNNFIYSDESDDSLLISSSS